MSWDMWWVVIPAIVLLFLAYRSRAWRIATFVIAVLAVFLFPIVSKALLSVSNTDTSVINKYDVDYTIAANGSMNVVETIDVEFTESKHGIFRFFDVTDGVDPSVTHPVTVESVKRCTDGKKCVSEPFTTYFEDGEFVAKIGSASTTYPAGTVNRYIIDSTAGNVITQPTDAATPQFYWDVIGSGWNMPIDRARVSVTFPAKPTDVRCITDSGPCETATADSRTVVGAYPKLPVRTPITWQADLPAAGLTVTPVNPQSAWWRSPSFWGVSALLSVIMALLIWVHRERTPDETPVFAAPTDDILPAVWTYREEAPDNSFQVLLLQLTQLGVLTLEVQPEGQYSGKKPEWFTIHRTDKPIPDGVRGAHALVQSLNVVKPGSSRTVTKTDVSIGSTLQSLTATLDTKSEVEARQAGYFRKSKTGALTNFLAALLPIASIVATVLFQHTEWGAALLVPSFVGLFSNKTQRTRLTDSGAAMRDQVCGLRTALSTPASVDRFDYALRARYFAQFLPWAVALDCADEWADACKPPPGTEPGSSGYDPSYATAWGAFNVSNAVSDAAGSVSAGAVSAYAATQSSSSSGGGGGFSSGGGSGGGGGGSW